MKFKLLVIVFFIINCGATLVAQFENPNNSVQFEVVEDDFKTPNGLELPAITLPNIKKSKKLLNKKSTKTFKKSLNKISEDV